jgi:Na+/alanine symporter
MAQQQNPSNGRTNPDLVTVFCNFFRAATRPAVTIIFAAVIAQVVIDRIDAPQWFIGLALSVIGFWFIDRGVHRWKNNGGS